MQFNPVNFIAGPAVITFDSQTYYTKGDIAVRNVRETFDVNASMHGLIDRRQKSLSAEVSFTPVGQIENISKYFPYAVGDIGKSIFASTDKPLVIHTLAGTKYTYARAALIKMPTLKCAATDTFFGEMTFLCILQSNVDPATADAFLKVESTAFSEATFDETKISSPGYTAAYGETPYNALEALDGFAVEISVDIIRDYVDRFGCVGARLKSLAASAKFTPIGLTEAQWATLLALDGASAVIPGQSLAKADTDLVITGGATPTAVSLTIHKAGINAAALAFGDAARIGELEFVSKRTWTAGAANPLFTFAVT
jgi:hypothetical protein